MRRLRSNYLFIVRPDCFRNLSDCLSLIISSLFESFTVGFNFFFILLTSFRAKPKIMYILFVLELKIAHLNLFVKLLFESSCFVVCLISNLGDKSQ